MTFVPLNTLLGPGVDPLDQLSTELERMLVAEAAVWEQTFDGGKGHTSKGLVVSVSDAARLMAKFLAHSRRAPDLASTAAGGGANTLHPVHLDVRAAILTQFPDATHGTGPGAALLAAVDLHEPSHWMPQRSFITCSECSILAWPPPEDPAAMWSDCMYPCRTVQEIAAALGVDIPPWEVTANVPVDTAAATSRLAAASIAELRAGVDDDTAARMIGRHVPRGTG